MNKRLFIFRLRFNLSEVGTLNNVQPLFIKENKMISLNNRLTTVSRFLKQGTIADIGSDHAYLPIYAIQNHLCECGIAGEVIQGPFKLQ